MTVDHRGGVVPQVPVVRAGRAAPLGEFRVPQDPGRRADQRIVRHEDDRQRRVPGVEPPLGRLDSRPAPGFPARVRIGMQHDLVGADDARLVGPGQALLLGQRAVGKERVVIQKEQRRDGGGAARPVPYRVWVLRRDDAQPAAHVHQELVAFLAAQLDRIGAACPQVMITGRPHHRGEPFAQRPEHPFDVPGQLPDIAGQQEPIAGRPRAKVFDDLPVLREGHMQVAEGEQPGRHGHTHGTSVSQHAGRPRLAALGGHRHGHDGGGGRVGGSAGGLDGDPDPVSRSHA